MLLTYLFPITLNSESNKNYSTTLLLLLLHRVLVLELKMCVSSSLDQRRASVVVWVAANERCFLKRNFSSSQRGTNYSIISLKISIANESIFYFYKTPSHHCDVLINDFLSDDGYIHTYIWFCLFLLHYTHHLSSEWNQNYFWLAS